QARIFEDDAHAVGERGQEANVCLVECMFAIYILHAHVALYHLSHHEGDDDGGARHPSVTRLEVRVDTSSEFLEVRGHQEGLTKLHHVPARHGDRIGVRIEPLPAFDGVAHVLEHLITIEGSDGHDLGIEDVTDAISNEIV